MSVSIQPRMGGDPGLADSRAGYDFNPGPDWGRHGRTIGPLVLIGSIRPRWGGPDHMGDQHDVTRVHPGPMGGARGGGNATLINTPRWAGSYDTDMARGRIKGPMGDNEGG